MSAKDKNPQKKPAPVALLTVCDLLLIGVAPCVFALFHHVLPQTYTVVLSTVSVSVAERRRGRSHSSAGPEPAGRSRDCGRHAGLQRNVARAGVACSPAWGRSCGQGVCWVVRCVWGFIWLPLFGGSDTLRSRIRAAYRKT